MTTIITNATKTKAIKIYGNEHNAKDNTAILMNIDETQEDWIEIRNYKNKKSAINWANRYFGK